MQKLHCTDFFSGILPSGDVVTVFTGNERAFDDADARWLLAEFPDRFSELKESARADEMPSALSADKQTKGEVEIGPDNATTETEPAPAKRKKS